MEKKIKVSVVFKEEFQCPDEGRRVPGRKPVGEDVFNFAIVDFCEGFEEKEQVFSIVRKTLPALRATAMRNLFEIVKEHDLFDVRNHNKTENTYRLNDDDRY